MEFSFAVRVSVPENVMVRELEGESVLLNLDSGHYFGLDDVGTRMWTALTTSDSIQSAYEGLLEEYDVEPDRLRRDLEDLADKLVEHGLVNISDPQQVQ